MPTFPGNFTKKECAKHTKKMYIKTQYVKSKKITPAQNFFFLIIINLGVCWATPDFAGYEEKRKKEKTHIIPALPVI